MERAGKILNRFQKSLYKSKVLVLGVAYKQDIDDYRESPALRVIEELEESGANVDFYDPYISSYKENGKVKEGISNIDENIVASYDLVMITAAHTTVDYEMVQKNAKFIFDTKNVMKNIADRNNIEIL